MKELHSCTVMDAVCVTRQFNDDRKKMMDMGQRINNAGLRLNLEVLGLLIDILGYLVVVRTRDICQVICMEVQGFFATIFYGTNNFQCLVILVSLVESSWN